MVLCLLVEDREEEGGTFVEPNGVNFGVFVPVVDDGVVMLFVFRK